MPYHTKFFSIPTTHEPTLKKKVDRLVKIGVLKKILNSQQAAPDFTIPNINGAVRFISDFRELNKTIKTKSFPILYIQHILLKLECFTYAISLGLPMVNCHISICAVSRTLYKILLLPSGECEYQKLLTGLCNSTDNLKENKNE